MQLPKNTDSEQAEAERIRRKAGVLNDSDVLAFIYGAAINYGGGCGGEVVPEQFARAYFGPDAVERVKFEQKYLNRESDKRGEKRKSSYAIEYQSEEAEEPITFFTRTGIFKIAWFYNLQILQKLSDERSE